VEDAPIFRQLRSLNPYGFVGVKYVLSLLNDHLRETAVVTASLWVVTGESVFELTYECHVRLYTVWEIPRTCFGCADYHLR